MKTEPMRTQKDRVSTKISLRTRSRIAALTAQQVRTQGGIVVLVYVLALIWWQIPQVNAFISALVLWILLTLLLGLLMVLTRRSATALAALYRNAIVDLEREREELTSQVNAASVFDKTTGVYTYECFEARLKEEVDRAHRYRRPATLLLVDLAQFHLVNERHGRALGNQILRRFALNILRTAVRSSDVVARYGGDEFAILLPETDAQQSLVVAQRIAEAAARGTILPEGQRLALPISHGLASYPHDAATASELVRAAQQALLKAKEAGTNHHQTGERVLRGVDGRVS